MREQANNLLSNLLDRDTEDFVALDALVAIHRALIAPQTDNDTAQQLRANFGPDAIPMLQATIAQRVYGDALSGNMLRALSEANTNDPGDELMHQYPFFFSLFNPNSAQKYLNEITSGEDSGEALYWIAAIHPEIASEVFRQTVLLKQLNSADIATLLERYKQTADTLLEPLKSQLDALTPEQLTDLAQHSETIASELVKNPALIDKLNAQQCTYIAIHQKIFAAKIIEDLDLLRRLNPKEAQAIVRAHPDCAPTRPKEPSEIKSLWLDKLERITRIYPSVADSLLSNPSLLLTLNYRQIYTVAIASKPLALALLNHPAKLKKLFETHYYCQGYPELEDVARTHSEFGEALLEKPEILESMDDLSLHIIGQASRPFAIGLLDHPIQLEKLSEWRINSIAEKHPVFLETLLEKPWALKYIQSSLFYIARNHPQFAIELLCNHPMRFANIYFCGWVIQGCEKRLDSELKKMKNIDPVHKNIESLRKATVKHLLCFNMLFFYKDRNREIFDIMQDDTDTISNTCIRQIYESKTIIELEKAINTERRQIEEKMTLVSTLFSIFHKPEILQQLTICERRIRLAREALSSRSERIFTTHSPSSPRPRM